MVVCAFVGTMSRRKIVIFCCEDDFFIFFHCGKCIRVYFQFVPPCFVLEKSLILKCCERISIHKKCIAGENSSSFFNLFWRVFILVINFFNTHFRDIIPRKYLHYNKIWLYFSGAWPSMKKSRGNPTMDGCKDIKLYLWKILKYYRIYFVERNFRIVQKI